MEGIRVFLSWNSVTWSLLDLVSSWYARPVSLRNFLSFTCDSILDSSKFLFPILKHSLCLQFIARIFCSWILRIVASDTFLAIKCSLRHLTKFLYLSNKYEDSKSANVCTCKFRDMHVLNYPCSPSKICIYTSLTGLEPSSKEKGTRNNAPSLMTLILAVLKWRHLTYYNLNKQKISTN